jgi:hypothetical protein
MAEREVLGGFDKPWKTNPEFIKAMKRCNEIKENYEPLEVTPEKLKQLEKMIGRGK